MPLVAVSTSETHSSGHGRKETRRCWAYEVGEHLHKREQWCDLTSFAVVERIRTVGDKKTVERRHYISSLAPDAERIDHAVRGHVEIENRLHWCLDVQFGDDYARARAGHVAHNLALVRHIALNLFRLHTTSRKTRIKTRRLLASASEELRAEMLGFEPEEEDDEDDG